MDKPLMMTEEEWKRIMDAHKEIINVLDRYNVPAGFATRILIDIERKIDRGMMRTVLEAKGVI